MILTNHHVYFFGRRARKIGMMSMLLAPQSAISGSNGNMLPMHVKPEECGTQMQSVKKCFPSRMDADGNTVSSSQMTDD